jgi:hypothetical protein
MDLHAPPFDFEIEFLLQLFDDALADIAEGSDVIGKYLHADGHVNDLVVSMADAMSQRIAHFFQQLLKKANKPGNCHSERSEESRLFRYGRSFTSFRMTP